MKKWLTILFAFYISFAFAQDIHVENGIAYIGDTPYVKIIKKNKKTFFIYDLKKNEKIIKVHLEKKYNERAQSYYPNTKLYFLQSDMNAAFSEIKVKSPKDIAELLFDKNLILPNGALNEELAVEYYETTPIGKRCERTIEQGFRGILYHKYRPVVKNDTLQINEVKFECVTTALFTRKVLYDHFGNWAKEIFRTTQSHLPELLWKDIPLFENDDKKFTVIARGLESRKTIYASIMVFDENNYDMLHKNSPYRDKIVALFADFIRNDKGNRKFYEVFWKKYDPKRWEQMQAYRSQKNAKRPRPPFTQKPGDTRKFEHN
ncbi:hypothetical protein KORDIASMS9_00121 [Kordia sp. SMS9]|uniref:hypothetical protein n=1 Tax=Kordia sp. SMS9 TaxID=2282170 RepID=UPI000E0D3398|nr:hypothetical protein [Kordia sp. SMS9]AXG67939.1 hypothetical protein KORDIASMS9_00121 [Kordia sp. SMS9]